MDGTYHRNLFSQKLCIATTLCHQHFTSRKLYITSHNYNCAFEVYSWCLRLRNSRRNIPLETLLKTIRYVVLCVVTLCYVMLCHVMLGCVCYVKLWYVMSCYVMPCQNNLVNLVSQKYDVTKRLITQQIKHYITITMVWSTILRACSEALEC